MIVVSAQQLLTTRNCAAERCENEADTNSRLCYRCAKRDSVTLHTLPPRITEPTLLCCTCHEWLPDACFTRRAHIKATHRRNRSAECRNCANKRRRQQRARRPKQRCAATNQSPRQARAGQQCRNYTIHGSPYCPAHTPKDAT